MANPLDDDGQVIACRHCRWYDPQTTTSGFCHGPMAMSDRTGAVNGQAIIQTFWGFVGPNWFCYGFKRDTGREESKPLLDAPPEVPESAPQEMAPPPLFLDIETEGNA